MAPVDAVCLAVRWCDVQFVIPSGIDVKLLELLYRYVPSYVVASALTIFVKLLALLLTCLPFIRSPGYSPEMRVIVTVLTLTRRLVTVTLPRARLSWDKLEYLYPALADVPREPMVIDDKPRGFLLRTGTGEHPGLLIWIFGGAFLAGNPEGVAGFAGRMGRDCGCDVLIPSHRLAPEFSLSHMLDDAREAYEWALQKYPANRIVIGGASSGGFLAALLAARLPKFGLPMPGGLVLLSAWLDLTGNTKSAQHPQDCFMGEEMLEFVRSYRGFLVPDGKLEEWSPAFQDCSGLPPVFTVWGEKECCVDENVAFAERCRQAGVEVVEVAEKDMFHTYALFRCWCPEAQKAHWHMMAFIEDVVRRPMRPHSIPAAER